MKKPLVLRKVVAYSGWMSSPSLQCFEAALMAIIMILLVVFALGIRTLLGYSSNTGFAQEIVFALLFIFALCVALAPVARFCSRKVRYVEVRA